MSSNDVGRVADTSSLHSAWDLRMMERVTNQLRTNLAIGGLIRTMAALKCHVTEFPEVLLPVASPQWITSKLQERSVAMRRIYDDDRRFAASSALLIMWIRQGGALLLRDRRVPKEAIGKSFIKRVGYGAVLFSLRQEALEMRRLMNREKRVPEPITRVINEGLALQDDPLGVGTPFYPLRLRLGAEAVLISSWGACLAGTRATLQMQYACTFGLDSVGRCYSPKAASCPDRLKCLVSGGGVTKGRKNKGTCAFSVCGTRACKGISTLHRSPSWG